MTSWKIHKEKWTQCKKCDLYKTRKKAVLLRGRIPCDVLFVGEAPGHSENVVGKPFRGPAGALLQRMIDRSLDGQYDYALTNLIACIPLEENRKLSQPPDKCIQACAERVTEIIKMCSPRVVIAVGKLAKKQLITKYSIVHPAAILRMDAPQKSLAIQATEAVISDAIFDAFDGED